MKTIKNLLFLFLLLFCHDKVSFASDDIIVDYIAPGITIEEIVEPETSITNDLVAIQELYGLYRPTFSWNIANSSYAFDLSTESSIIYSNYGFTSHGGKLNFKLPESAGPSTAYYKFYLYEFTNYTKVAELSVRKATTSTFAINNLTTSKGYYFGVKPNNDLTNIINGKVWK